MMDAGQLLRVNAHLDLYVGDQHWRTRIEDVREGEWLAVADPWPWRAEEDRFPGEMRVFLAHPMGIFRFAVQVVRRTKGPPPILVLSWPKVLERAQRRSFVRFAIRLPLLYRPLPAEQDQPFLHGRTVDISAGGFLFVPEPDSAPVLGIGQEIAFRYQLPDTTRVEGLAEVRHWTELPEGPLAVGVRYRGLDARTEDRIVSFIFREQRRLRREGLV